MFDVEVVVFPIWSPDPFMWPITIYVVALSHAIRQERLVNAQVRKWPRLPKCLSMREWSPLATLIRPGGFAKEQPSPRIFWYVVRLPPLLASVADAKVALRHQDIVGHVQHGTGGFGLASVHT